MFDISQSTRHIKIFKSEYTEALEQAFAKWINEPSNRVVKGSQFAASDKYVVLLVFYELLPG